MPSWKKRGGRIVQPSAERSTPRPSFSITERSALRMKLATARWAWSWRGCALRTGRFKADCREQSRVCLSWRRTRPSCTRNWGNPRLSASGSRKGLQKPALRGAISRLRNKACRIWRPPWRQLRSERRYWRRSASRRRMPCVSLLEVGRRGCCRHEWRRASCTERSFG